MRNNTDFISLHNHTEFSNFKLTDSIIKTQDLLDYTNSLGNKGVAITDHNVISAHISAINHVVKQKNSGVYPKDFKLILGNEIYLVDEDEMNLKIKNKERVKFYHFILLAKDEIGYKQIRELSAKSWERAFSHRGLVRTPNFYKDFNEIIGSDKGHVIASTACLGGFLATTILKTQEDKNACNEVYDFLDWCIDMFGEDDIYLEMQPSILEYDEDNNEIFNEQKFVNERIVKIAEVYNLKTIITTDAHYLKEEDSKIHEAFLNSDEEGSNHREVAKFYQTAHVMEISKFYELMPYLGEDIIDKCIDNSMGIWDKITSDVTYNMFHNPKIPLTPVPNKVEWYKFDTAILEKYPNMKQLWSGDNIQESYLMSQLFRGIDEWNIKGEKLLETLNRLEEECKIITGYNKNNNTHVGSYFTTMQVLIDVIWEEANALVGAGRGSGVGFLINRLLGITQINPLNYGILLPPWRFLSSDVKSMPDIDFDTPDYKKEVVFEASKKYFESIGGSFIRIATYSTLGSKSTIKTACRGVGINNDDSAFIASLLVTTRGVTQTIRDAYYGKEGEEVNKEFKNVIDKYNELNLLEILLKLEGLKVGCSSHASGVLPLNGKVTDTNGIMRTPNGELITTFNLEESEQCGNLKYDYLLTAGTGLLQNTFETLIDKGHIKWQGSLRKTYNKYLHPDVIQQDIKEVWDNVNSGKILNLFQFNSGVGEICIKKIQPNNLIEMSAANSLMRLQAEGEVPMDRYVRYKNNPDEWNYDMDKYNLTKEEKNIMYELVDSEGGTMCSQEVMMLSVIKLAGFSIGEANKMRKVISKKKIKEIPHLKEEYMRRGLKIGTSKNLLQYNWNEQISLQLG